LNGKCSNGNRYYSNASALFSLKDVEKWLKRQAIFPIYGKSVHGSYGKTNILIEDYDQNNKTFNLSGNKKLTADELLKYISNIRGYGYIFQEPVKPDPILEPFIGPRLAGLRIVVLCDPLGHATIHRAVIKIPVSNNISDNFEHGQSGNMLGAIDIESGEVFRIVQGLNLREREVQVHPDTGQTIHGLKIPNWADIKDLVIHAAKLIPGMFIQGWDVALSDKGPVLFEVNPCGDVDLLQIAYKKPYVDKAFNAFMESLGGWDPVLRRSSARKIRHAHDVAFEPYVRFGLDAPTQLKMASSR